MSVFAFVSIQKAIDPFLGSINNSFPGVVNAVAPPAVTSFNHPMQVPIISPAQKQENIVLFLHLFPKENMKFSSQLDSTKTAGKHSRGTLSSHNSILY